MTTSSRLGYSPLIAAFVGLLSASVVHGDETWSGGTNQWDVGNTADWSDSTWSESYDPTTGIVTNPGDAADFTTTGGTVTVSDTPTSGVATNELYFQNNNNGAYDLTDGTIYTDNGYNGTMIEVDNGSGPVTIDSNIDQINGNATTYAANSFPGDNQHINHDSASNLTINGTLDYENQTTLFMGANSTGKIIFNGTINATTSGLYTIGGGTVEFGANSNMTALDSAHNGSNLSLVEANGTVILDADTFLSTSAFEILGGNGIFLNGAFTGTQNMTDERASGTIGGLQAVESGWSGAIYLDNGPATQTFSQVAGGRFTYSSTATGPGGVGINGNNLTYLITSGDGTVVLATGNSYTDYMPNGQAADGGNLLADLKAKKTLITNASGTSAFGGSAGEVQVEAGKLLGGTGYTGQGQNVVAMDATSVIEPGDPGDASLGIKPSIGTLNLAGGLVANKGVTWDFKLTGGLSTTDGLGNPAPEAGVDNDFLNVGSFTLGGTVTVELTALDALATGTVYTLFSDSNSFDTEDVTDFTFVAPTGYALDSSYGASDGLGDGKDLGYDYEGGVLTVELVATPEPSTYAMMLGGVALLGFCLRRRAALVL